MSRVTISMKAARHAEIAMVRYLREDPETAPLAELRDAIRRAERVPEPKRKPRKPPKRPSPELTRAFAVLLPDAKAQKREHRASIREAVFKRAGGQCEGPGPQWFGVGSDERCGNAPTDLSHLFGKGRGRLPESERTCSAWCRACHVGFTLNRPSAAVWWLFIEWWLKQQGFIPEATRAHARLVFVETRSMLGAGLKERNNA